MEQRILVIDSHPVYAKKIVAFLEGLTFKNVGLAETGQKALAEIKIHAPDLVIISSLLADMSSADVCKEIVEMTEGETKIIIQTGLFTDPADVEAFKTSGADLVLERKEKNLSSLQKGVEGLLLNSTMEKYYRSFTK